MWQANKSQTLCVEKQIRVFLLLSQLRREIRSRINSSTAISQGKECNRYVYDVLIMISAATHGLKYKVDGCAYPESIPDEIVAETTRGPNVKGCDDRVYVVASDGGLISGLSLNNAEIRSVDGPAEVAAIVHGGIISDLNLNMPRYPVLVHIA
jgi:hypothetical protein